MAASSGSRISHDTHSTTAGSGWSTKRLAITAFFCALSLVVSFIEIPIFPPAAWLKYDPSCVVALVAGLCFGPVTGVLVTTLAWVLRLLFSFNPWGNLMAIIANVTLIAPAVVLYERLGRTRKALVVGLVAGAAVSLVCCIVANIIVTPLYTAVSVADVIDMIVPYLIPFNLIKLVLNCVITALVVGPVQKLVER